MSAPHVIGKDAKLYYNTGSIAVPTWTEILNVMDLNVPLSKGEADVSTRASSWEQMGGGLKAAGLDFGYLHEFGVDAIFDALRGSFFNDTVIEFAVMDGDIASSGAEGLHAFMNCFDMSRGEELQEGLSYDFSFKVARALDGSTLLEPDWMVIP